MFLNIRITPVFLLRQLGVYKVKSVLSSNHMHYPLFEIYLTRNVVVAGGIAEEFLSYLNINRKVTISAVTKTADSLAFFFNGTCLFV